MSLLPVANGNLSRPAFTLAVADDNAIKTAASMFAPIWQANTKPMDVIVSVMMLLAVSVSRRLPCRGGWAVSRMIKTVLGEFFGEVLREAGCDNPVSTYTVDSYVKRILPLFMTHSGLVKTWNVSLDWRIIVDEYPAASLFFGTNFAVHGQCQWAQIREWFTLYTARAALRRERADSDLDSAENSPVRAQRCGVKRSRDEEDAAETLLELATARHRFRRT